MNLYDILYEKRNEIASEWYKAVIETFPADSSKFFLDVKDKFANPMGHAFIEELPYIVDGIFEKCPLERYELALENLIRIRAIQNLTPAEACGYITLLKKILRDRAEAFLKDKKAFHMLLDIESKIDEAAGLSFNYYIAMKEKLYEIKANETKKTFGKMIDKLNARYDKFKKN